MKIVLLRMAETSRSHYGSFNYTNPDDDVHSLSNMQEQSHVVCQSLCLFAIWGRLFHFVPKQISILNPMPIVYLQTYSAEIAWPASS